MFITLVFILAPGIMTRLIHLEGLWLLRALPRVFNDHPRLGVLAVVLTCLLLHVIEIGLYSGGFMVTDRVFKAGQFTDESHLNFLAQYYYSAVTFTAVGYGDILPTGNVRLLAVAESLNGLILIGWSGAFTFLAMQKLWSERTMHERDDRRTEHLRRKQQRSRQT